MQTNPYPISPFQDYLAAIETISEEHKISRDQAALLIACDSENNSFEDLTYRCSTTIKSLIRISGRLRKLKLVRIEGNQTYIEVNQRYCFLKITSEGRAIVHALKYPFRPTVVS